MASVETLQSRVDSFKGKIEKKRILIDKKLALIEKKKAGLKKLGYNYPEDRGKIIADFREDKNRDAYWLSSDIENYEEDILRAEREIIDFSKSLEDYEKQLAEAQSKAESRNVKVIIDFLEGWKKQCQEYYDKAFIAYYREYAEVVKACHDIDKYGYGTGERKNAELIYKNKRAAFDVKCRGVFTTRDTLYGPVSKKIEEGEWEFIMHYVSYNRYEDALTKLVKDLKAEAERKYDYIIARTNEIVGTITDASNLTIDGRQNLNGHIIGTNGIANVDTIIAAGPIKRAHFRTLIKPVRG